MKETSFVCDGDRGLKLHGRRWHIERPVGVVAGVHGYSEHSGRYAHFAEYLNRNGYEVFWIDFPGHGMSEGRRSDITEFSEYIHALEKLVREVERQNFGLPLHLFAHSLGGLVALRFLQTSELAKHIHSAIISGPLLGLFHYPPRLLPMIEILAWMLPNLSLSNKSELADKVLTHDEEISRHRDADPLVNSTVTIRWVREFIRARAKAFSEVEKIHLPILFLKAELEKVVDPNEISRFFELLRAPKKELKVYSGMLHEVVNEIGRERVFADILNWLKGSVRLT